MSDDVGVVVAAVIVVAAALVAVPFPVPAAVAVLAAALERAGYRIDHSEAGLYLWATKGDDAWTRVDELAGLGILVAPGSFYGAAGAQHVRFALTATDAAIAAAAARLG